MAQQDYVRRVKSKPKAKRGQNQPPRRHTGNTAQPSSTSGKVMWISLGMLVVGGFGYAIWNLGQSKPEQAAAPIVAAPPVQVEEDPLPPKPQEEWSYIKELENKKVVVEVPKQELSKRPYQMQCGSFRAPSQADELKARIAFQGLESDVRRTEGKNGVWYRVVLGPYERKRSAERDRHKLSRASIYGCKIWYW